MSAGVEGGAEDDAITGDVVAVAEAPRCLNCGVPLAGRYCAACGQRDDPHVHRIGHFLGEAFEGLTHADSRLWRTLWPLLARPGFLTREFFAGRRQRYLPPFRLYIVVSLLFFIVLALLPDAGIIQFGDMAQTDAAPSAADGKAATAASRSARICGDLDYQGPFGSWLAPRLKLGCIKSVEDEGSLGRAFLHNIPRAMFLFLPLIAAVMLLIYWRPRRYYVEHLLFYIHNHAMIFLLGTLLIPVFWLLRGTVASSILSWVVALWLIWYLFRAMRIYYGQGRWRTLAKYLFMGTVYFSVSIALLVLTALVSVVTL